MEPAYPIRLRRRLLEGFCAIALWLSSGPGVAGELIPPLSQIKPDHPRVLLRPQKSPWAMSEQQLREIPRDDHWAEMHAQVQKEKSASAQAMVWLLTGDQAAAHRAIDLMRSYRQPPEVDTFHLYFTLTQFALAYDWLSGCRDFTPQIKTEVRLRMSPLAERGLQLADDHMFHNYIWMSAGGVALWALATAGDDAEANRLFERIRDRFNLGLFPAWKYLDGLPSEPMGYWALYVFTPGMLTLLAAQSAFERNLLGTIQQSDGDWVNRHLENLVHSTLPNMRYIPWGDLQSGPNGGVTRDMAGIVDAITWVTGSPDGAYLSNWLANKRGLQRFRSDTAVFYFLYTRHMRTAPALPPLSFLAGNQQSGHFIARSGWGDGDTVVAFRSTDHFGDHHHYDQGSFLIYRNGLLAVDPPVYSKIRGPQQANVVHNTLVLGGQPQRPVRGQWFKTVDEFERNLEGGRQLETGDILFWEEGGLWAAVAGQFAQAYSGEQVQSCVRQLLFVRPGKIVIVDQLAAPAGRALPEVEWLLQLPQAPTVEGRDFWTTNSGSWLRCRPLLPSGSRPKIDATAVNTHRVSLPYQADDALQLVHFIEVGDGSTPAHPEPATTLAMPNNIRVTVAGDTYDFSTQAPFGVTLANER